MNTEALTPSSILWHRADQEQPEPFPGKAISRDVLIGIRERDGSIRVSAGCIYVRPGGRGILWIDRLMRHEGHSNIVNVICWAEMPHLFVV